MAIIGLIFRGKPHCIGSGTYMFAITNQLEDEMFYKDDR